MEFSWKVKHYCEVPEYSVYMSFDEETTYDVSKWNCNGNFPPRSSPSKTSLGITTYKSEAVPSGFLLLLR